jgi:hypothetical protein
MTALHITFWKITTSLQRNLHNKFSTKILVFGRKTYQIFYSNVFSGTTTIILDYGTAGYTTYLSLLYTETCLC